MNKPDWKIIVELGSTIAIVASLIFVGFQMKQTQEIALSAAYQARSDTSISIRTTAFESDTLLSALDKSNSGRSAELTSVESVALRYYFYLDMTYLENVHFQYQNGFLSEEQWQTNLDDIRFSLTNPNSREIWEMGMNMRESFEAVVNEVIREMDAQ